MSNTLEQADPGLFRFKRGKLTSCTKSEFYGSPAKEEIDSLEDYLTELGFSGLMMLVCRTNYIQYIRRVMFIFLSSTFILLIGMGSESKVPSNL
jgi:hypothetical protein